MAHTNKIPEGIYFISKQGHWRYGNSVCDEEWVIPEAKIKVDGTTLSFGKAITSNGKYTDIKDKSKDTCFGITLEDNSSRLSTINSASGALATTADNDEYTTHIIQKGILRFIKSDFNDCFENSTSSGIGYSIGQKIYLNSSGKFTNNLERIIESSYRIVELGEVTNITNNLSGNSDYIDLSVNIKNHNKIETDTAKFVERCDAANNFELDTSDFGSGNVCVFSWNQNGRVIPADIVNRREVAGLYIGEITEEFASDLANKQIELIRNGKIYLDEMPSARVYATGGTTIKEWVKLNNLAKGSQLYLEKDGSLSTSPYLDNDINGYSCPIMTYLGQTTDGGKYIFYVDIKRPEIRKLEDLYLLKTFTPTISPNQTTSSDTATIAEDLDITEVLNYGNYTVNDLDKIEESLDIHLYVKSAHSDYAGYIFKDKWSEIKQGFFHFDTVRSYGYIWNVVRVNEKVYLRMNIADGFGLSIESGKNTGPIVCNSKFQCKVIVKRFNDSKLQLDAGVNTSFEESILNNERTATRIIRNAQGEKIKALYDLPNHKIKLTDENESPVKIVATLETPSKAKLKRVYDEDKYSELSTNIYSSAIGAGNSTTDSTKTHFSTSSNYSGLGQAMRAIYETPLALWNYKTDPNTDKQKIGIIVDRLNERTGSLEIGSRPIRNFDVARTFNYSTEEKNEIKRFIKLLTDTNESGVDNTNAIGTIFKALKETQQRLIDLEAATYGLTSNKITSTNNNTSTIDKNKTSISSNSLDFGLNRLVRALSFEIFGDANPTSQTLEFDESSLSYFDFVEKALLGTKPTVKSGTSSYEADKTADAEMDKNGNHTRTHLLSGENSKYFSYNEESDSAGNGFSTDAWQDQGGSKINWPNNKIYKFNGVEDATVRLINRAKILTKMIFYDENANANKAPTFTGSILTFSHTKIHYN